MSNEPNEDVSGSVVSNRTMNLAVSAALMNFAVVILALVVLRPIRRKTMAASNGR